MNLKTGMPTDVSNTLHSRKKNHSKPVNASNLRKDLRSMASLQVHDTENQVLQKIKTKKFTERKIIFERLINYLFIL